MELNNLNAFESMVMRLVDRGSEPLEAVTVAEDRLIMNRVDRVA